MLTLLAPRIGRLCDGLSRRNFLSVGTLALGGLSLADLLRLEARAAGHDTTPQKSVIFVYLPGGPSCKEPPPSQPGGPGKTPVSAWFSAVAGRPWQSF